MKKVVCALILLMINIVAALYVPRDNRSFRSPPEAVYTFKNNTFRDVWASSSDGWIRRNCRVNKNTFISICKKIEPYWTFPRIGRPGQSLEFSLACCLIYLSSQGDHRSFAAIMGISKSSSVRTVNKVIEILSCLCQERISFLTFLFLIYSQ